MNGKIRAELTELLADHLVETQIARYLKAGDGRAYAIPHRQSYLEIAEDAMDFIYGQEDETNTPDTDVRDLGDSAGSCGPGCRCGLDGWDPLADSLTGVVHPPTSPAEPLREAFVYLGPPSRTGEYVPAPTSADVPKVPSPPGPDTAGE